MAEDGVNSRKRGWKAFQVNYDDIFSRSDRMCSVCLNEQQIVALLAMTEYLAWPTRWVSAEIEPQQEVVEVFAQNLERQLIMACCDDNMPIQYRYNEDGELERSTNGGANWIDAPQYDPRVYSPQYPPMSGDDSDENKCIAATGAAALIKEQVGDQLTDDMTRYTLKQLIENWVGTLLESSNPFLALMTVISNQIFALIIATLRPALTDEVYELLQCIFYCNLTDDISVNTTQWQQIRSDITDQIGGIAGIFLEHLIYLLGTGGTTNLVRAGGAAAADCSDCGCDEHCAADTWTPGMPYDGGGLAYVGTVVDSGEDFITIQSMDRGDGQQMISITPIDRVTCCFVYWEFVGTPPGSALKWYSPCGTVPDVLTVTRNDLMGQCNEVTGYLFQMSAGSWQIKFTFLGGC